MMSNDAKLFILGNLLQYNISCVDFVQKITYKKSAQGLVNKIEFLCVFVTQLIW